MKIVRMHKANRLIREAEELTREAERVIGRPTAAVDALKLATAKAMLATAIATMGEFGLEEGIEDEDELRASLPGPVFT